MILLDTNVVSELRKVRLGKADANVIALFTVPVAWTILAFAVLMSTTRNRQVAILVAPLIAALPSIASGSLL